ncbi:uncharacterized protein AB675_3341 [Cyphellophora attinorum]|uniref:F-box domain-containing protein n=1 Tax=Cyphellophora attinorum TaxID=1664694 RepID=A0A0N0NM62_9EURO|nr:uncharacterized protein AB675_3341 [Phialophora attinorum]KPI39839.1 hypothetical protein AB675_3341 [Phialophora attinorum]
MSGLQPAGGPGYLTGAPAQPISLKRARRDKPLRKFHIPCLEKRLPLPPKPLHGPGAKNYVPPTVNDFSKHPPGTGKAAKKARRRARKRYAKKEAKARAEEATRQALAAGEMTEEQAADERKRQAKQLYHEVKQANAKAEIERNITYTRSMSKAAKDEVKAANKARAEGEKKGVRDTSHGKQMGLKRKFVDLEDIEEGSVQKESHTAQEVNNANKSDIASTSNKRKRDEEDSVVASGAKKVKTTHDDDSDASSEGSVSMDESEYDPIKDLPNVLSRPDSLLSLPDEVLERVMGHCDPITQTFLGLTHKRLGMLAIEAGAGFPVIRDRYGSDIERHRFMQMLEGFMNPEYIQKPETDSVTEMKEREKLKQRRLCYICRKYLPINGKKCQYWKNCPKKAAMPYSASSVAARRAEVDRRRGTPAAGQQSSLPTLLPALPQLQKEKPVAQTFTWRDEDWTTLSLGLVKSRERLPDVKYICPKCTLTVHTVHLGWPPETPIVRWLEEGNPAGGKMNTGHEPLSAAEFGEVELEEDPDAAALEAEVEEDADGA